MEVIVNPANQLAHAEYLELNELVNDNNNEEVVIQQQDLQEDWNLLAQEENLTQVADLDLQHIQVPQENFLHEEIQPEDLMNEEEMLEAQAMNNQADNLNLENLDGPCVQGQEGILQDIIVDLNEQLEQNEHHEIQEVQEVQQMQEGLEFQAHNLNVGMALMFRPQVNPVWVERSRNADATRPWAKFFAKGNDECLHVPIPTQWANFFTAMLLSPGLFDWAREFLSSKAVSCLGLEAGVIDYYVPKQCPSEISCAAATEEDYGLAEKKEEVGQEQRSTPEKRSVKRTCPLVDTELRRSSRGKQVSVGFRKDSCSDRRCLFCLPNPPILPKQAIRKIGKELGQLEDDQLTDEALLTKKEKKKIRLEKNKNKGEGGPKKNKKNNEDNNN